MANFPRESNRKKGRKGKLPKMKIDVGLSKNGLTTYTGKKNGHNVVINVYKEENGTRYQYRVFYHGDLTHEGYARDFNEAKRKLAVLAE